MMTYVRHHLRLGFSVMTRRALYIHCQFSRSLSVSCYEIAIAQPVGNGGRQRPSLLHNHGRFSNPISSIPIRPTLVDSDPPNWTVPPR